MIKMDVDTRQGKGGRGGVRRGRKGGQSWEEPRIGQHLKITAIGPRERKGRDPQIPKWAKFRLTAVLHDT